MAKTYKIEDVVARTFRKGCLAYITVNDEVLWKGQDDPSHATVQQVVTHWKEKHEDDPCRSDEYDPRVP
jgi:hypothetical protein